MTQERRQTRCYDYVNQPYERVCDVLRDNALTVFQSATKAAVSGAESLVAQLRVDAGGVGIKTDIKVQVKSVEEKKDTIPSPRTRLLLEWQAATMPSLFPVMNAVLSIYPLTATETQLEFLGNYEPPFGPVGKAMNAMIGYRVAEFSVRHFLDDVAAYLRENLVVRRFHLSTSGYDCGK